MLYIMMMMPVCLYNCQSSTLIVKHPTFHNLRLEKPIICSYSTKPTIPINVDSSDFKISFLRNKCGKPLINACKCLDFDSSAQRPDSVLELLGTYGFPPSSITKFVSYYPLILSYHPENILKPKLDHLLSIFQSQADVVAIVTKHPCILVQSLTNHLIPSLNLLNSITGCYANTFLVLKSNPYILHYDLSKNILLNYQFLLTLGVPHSQILKLLRYGLKTLVEPHDKLHNVAVKAKDMGFDLESSSFLTSIRTLCWVTDSTWEGRCVLLRSFGFPDHEILSMFKKMPGIMCYNDKAIYKKMHFFLKKLHWTPIRLSSNPYVLTYSLEKRTIPRCSVLQVLVIKSLSSESYMLSSILVMAEEKFFKHFVAAHEVEVPEVIEAYQGKLKFDEYTFKQKGQLSLTQF